MESIDGIERMPRSLAKGPPAFVANRVDGGQADNLFESLELADNNRAMRPGTGPGHIEMVAARFGRVPGASAGRDVLAKGIGLARKFAFTELLVGKLRLNRHVKMVPRRS